jgi:hypothetical protein
VLSLFTIAAVVTSGCFNDEISNPVRSVLVEVTVMNHANKYPVYDAHVQILSDKEQPLYPQIIGYTDANGQIALESDSDHLAPGENFKVMVTFQNNPTVESFAIPDDPNEGSTYLIEVAVEI